MWSRQWSPEQYWMSSTSGVCLPLIKPDFIAFLVALKWSNMLEEWYWAFSTILHPFECFLRRATSTAVLSCIACSSICSRRQRQQSENGQNVAALRRRRRTRTCLFCMRTRRVRKIGLQLSKHGGPRKVHIVDCQACVIPPFATDQPYQR